MSYFPLLSLTNFFISTGYIPHTVLSLCVCISSIMVNNRLFKDIKITKYANIISMILAITIVLGRLISGVHWFTDIIGGILFSIALLKSFKTILDLKK